MRQLVPLPVPLLVPLPVPLLVPLSPRLAPLLLPLLLPQLIPPPVLLLGAQSLETQHRPDASAAAAATLPQGSASRSSEEAEEEDSFTTACRRADKDSSSEDNDVLAVGVLRPSNDRQQNEWLHQPPQPPDPLQPCISTTGPVLEGVIGGALTVPMAESRGAVAGAALDQLQLENRAKGSSESQGADLLPGGTDTVEVEAAVASEEGEQPWFRTADRSVKEEGRGRDECMVCEEGSGFMEFHSPPHPSLSLSCSLPPLPPASSLNSPFTGSQCDDRL